MPAGQLDRRVTLRRFVTRTNAANEDEKAWVDLATVWAAKSDISDGEQVRAQQVGKSINRRFLIRWSRKVGDLNPADQLRYPARDGALHKIVGVKELGRQDWLEITACAIANALASSPEV